MIQNTTPTRRIRPANEYLVIEKHAKKEKNSSINLEDKNSSLFPNLQIEKNLQEIKNEAIAKIEHLVKKLKKEIKYFCYNRTLKLYKMNKLNELLDEIRSPNSMSELIKVFQVKLTDKTLIEGRYSRTNFLLKDLLKKTTS